MLDVNFVNPISPRRIHKVKKHVVFTLIYCKPVVKNVVIKIIFSVAYKINKAY